uniref:Protein kinase domain-containing protein n=1 Tax=Psilocybe cubensis TaxID=181762 RepID=A0A8H7Y5I7_PSICU
MSDPLLPPGLPLPPSIQGSGIRAEVLGFPSLSKHIEDHLPGNEVLDEDRSVRIYTILKVLHQSPWSSLYMCNWHSPLRPKEGSPPLIEIFRFGENSRLIALKCIDCPTLSSSNIPQIKELDALRKLSPHRNIVSLYDYFFSLDQRKLYLATGAMEGNLYQFIKARKGRALAGGLVSSILFQTLLGLNHIHSNGYFHRDLIPENILITTQAPDAVEEKDVVVIVKISDFGLARELGSEGPYTEYVTVRWYRSPEVLLLSRNYTSAIDMWAFGAIAAEVLNLSPLFPGNSIIDQCMKICEVLGSPSDEARLDENGDRLDGGAWPEGIRLAQIVGYQFPAIVPRPFSSFFEPTVPASLLSCIKNLLEYDPGKRLTSQACLSHIYFIETSSHREVPADLQRH